MCNSFSIKKNQYFPYKALNVFYILYFYDSYSKRSKKKKKLLKKHPTHKYKNLDLP